MARTTKAQQLGDAGVAAVLKECTSHGWVGEYVVKDFGEDLVFQTNFNEVMDPFRIYGQVKSYSNKPKVIRISRSHLLKWTLMAEPLVIFVYVRNENMIYYFNANVRITFYQIWTRTQKTIQIPLKDFVVLTPKDITILVWLSRRRGLNFLFSEFSAEREDVYLSSAQTPIVYQSDEEEAVGTLFFKVFISHRLNR